MVVEAELSAGFGPVVWLIYLKAAVAVDGVSQANGNETLVLGFADYGFFVPGKVK